jgi:hypothetical protein
VIGVAWLLTSLALLPDDTEVDSHCSVGECLRGGYGRRLENRVRALDIRRILCRRRSAFEVRAGQRSTWISHSRGIGARYSALPV